MNELEIFTYGEQAVRTVVLSGEPWFVAGDVGLVLGMGNVHSSLALLDDDEKALHTMETGISVSIVSEAGLYSLILRSRKPEAKLFKRWITHDVLPQLRRTGSYGTAAAIPNHAEALRGWAAEIEARELAQAQLAIAGPKAESWDTLAAAEGDFSVREAAQILDRDPGIKTGQNRLFLSLSKLGWIDRRGHPYQRKIDSGWLASIPRTYEHPRSGEKVLAKPQVRITVKGLHELHQVLGGERPLQLPLDIGVGQ